MMQWKGRELPLCQTPLNMRSHLSSVKSDLSYPATSSNLGGKCNNECPTAVVILLLLNSSVLDGHITKS